MLKKHLMNYIKYANSQYFNWLGRFATVLGLIAILPIDTILLRYIVLFCIALAFIIPFIESIIKHNFKIKTIGKSNVSFKFGDLFDEECFVVTINRYFDVNPTGEYISEGSVLGKFVEKFFSNNVSELENLINNELQKIDDKKDNGKYDYGTCIKINVNEKIVYFLVFTDRKKSDQPHDFYQKSVQGLLKTIADENHGKTMAIPLLGGNSNLSDSGFSNDGIAFKSLIAMINNFEISNQRSELKIKIIALPGTQAELINVVKLYSK